MTDDRAHQAAVGVQIVGTLLKHWPATEAPLLVQIAFYEELRRAVVSLTSGTDQTARWFQLLGNELTSNLTTLFQVAAQVVGQSEWAKNRLESAIDEVPYDLRRVLREARS